MTKPVSRINEIINIITCSELEFQITERLLRIIQKGLKRQKD